MWERKLFHSKKKFPDGAIREMVLWKLPERSNDCSYEYKYRLQYGLANGKTIVRYDNEKGKGDHKHIYDREISYKFVDITTLVTDFLHDVTIYREKEDA